MLPLLWKLYPGRADEGEVMIQVQTNTTEKKEIHYRHEWKHEISRSDLISIRQRLRAIAEPDPHTVDGRYLIRSLYFDNLYDKALREKIDGVNRREKFRIRYYNLKSIQ